MNLTVAKAFMRAAGMKPGIIDAILELGGRISKAEWTRSVVAGGVTVWRYAAATPEGNFDITLRITPGPLCEKIAEVLPAHTISVRNPGPGPAAVAASDVQSDAAAAGPSA